jgi:hypothetical protein
MCCNVYVCPSCRIGIVSRSSVVGRALTCRSSTRTVAVLPTCLSEGPQSMSVMGDAVTMDRGRYSSDVQLSRYRYG